MLRHAVFAGVLALLCTAVEPLHAQGEQVLEGARLELTRAELEQLLATYEQAARSNAYSGDVRAHARTEARLIRQRLEEGDFRVGDRVVTQIEDEPAMSDTFPVRSGRRIALPVIGEISLRGVLRSELESHLTEQLARYIKDPEVKAQSLIRLGILGEVGSPGFYAVPADALLTDALMLAGGPSATANVSGLRIERNGEEIWADERLQRAVNDGRTLDQLNLRAGDRIRVPTASDMSVTKMLRIARWAVALVPSVILLGTRLF